MNPYINQHTYFHAPWSKALVVLSILVSAMLASIPGILMFSLPYAAPWPLLLLIALLPLVILVSTALFTVRGYRLEGDRLFVQRLFWWSVIPISDLTRAWHDPNAMQSSIRLFGNGGLFSFTGLFRNKTIGMYRAWATDPARAVVLQFPARTIVVTPEDPQAFLQLLPLMPSTPSR